MNIHQLDRWQSQLDEVDVIESMFPMEGEVEIDANTRKKIQDAIDSNATGTDEDTSSMSLSIHIRFEPRTIQALRISPILCLKMAPTYPTLTALDVYLQCPELARPVLVELNEKLQHLAQSLRGQVASLELYQLAHELLTQYEQEEAVSRPATAIDRVL